MISVSTTIDLGFHRKYVPKSGLCCRLEIGVVKFAVGDHVSWNSEAGRVTGRIVRVHHADFDYKGHRHRASKDAPQYEIKSDKTDHIAAHKEAALTKIG